MEPGAEAFHTHQVEATFQINMETYTHPKNCFRRMPCRSSHNKGVNPTKTRNVRGETGQAAKSNRPLRADNKKGCNFLKLIGFTTGCN